MEDCPKLVNIVMNQNEYGLGIKPMRFAVEQGLEPVIWR